MHEADIIFRVSRCMSFPCYYQLTLIVCGMKYIYTIAFVLTLWGYRDMTHVTSLMIYTYRLQFKIDQRIKIMCCILFKLVQSQRQLLKFLLLSFFCHFCIEVGWEGGGDDCCREHCINTHHSQVNVPFCDYKYVQRK